jgi:hypothetical protein
VVYLGFLSSCALGNVHLPGIVAGLVGRRYLLISHALATFCTQWENFEAFCLKITSKTGWAYLRNKRKN